MTFMLPAATMFVFKRLLFSSFFFIHFSFRTLLEHNQ
jgi:hypothetical protein